MHFSLTQFPISIADLKADHISQLLVKEGELKELADDCKDVKGKGERFTGDSGDCPSVGHESVYTTRRGETGKYGR